ncbi:MAG: hypothetical protein QOG80_1511, partial [Pseudonocardiales bacterium]|nr:hypothetical protein [Pseudonocardiales bacterium]
MPAAPRIPALDGVRALAVLAVLASHAGIPGVAGGFIGVDVFFVLSGFLITSLLLDESNREGRADLGGFWARRARRLLPAALVMITAVVAARSWLRPDAIVGLRDDALSAALWFSNWRWATQGTDYFSQGGTASPLQHTWSLAVEEQFYLVWPCLLVLALAGVAGARARSRRVVTLALMGVAVSAFVTWRLTSHATPGRVYFGTDVRAQELLIGAALAGLLAPTWQWATVRRRAQRSPQSAARSGLPLLLSASGLVVLGIAAHRVDGTPNDFRHGLLLIVSLASAALIAGLMLDRRMLVSRLLSTAPLVALGRISYGVYLWHWPAFGVVTGARTGLRTYELAGLRFGVTIVLALLSLVLVERPAQRVRIRPSSLIPAVAGAVGAVLVFTACAAPSGRVPIMIPAAGADVPPGTTAEAVQAAEVKATLPAKPRPQHHGGPMRVDVFGDSIGWTLAQYLPPTSGIEVLNRTALGCGIVRGGPYTYFGTQYDESDTCNTWPERWRAQVAADQPDEVVLVVGRWETMNRSYN